MSLESKNNVLEKIIEIIESPEIMSLIDSEQNITCEISIPILDSKVKYDQIKNNNVILETENKSFDEIFDNLIKNNIVTKKIINNFKNDILNGICRQTDLKKNSERYYEEICYVISISDDELPNIFILTIKKHCSSELIPSIVDYDQSYEYIEYLYDIKNTDSNLIRKIGSKYDIYNNLDSSVILTGNSEELINVLNNLMLVYNIFNN